MHHVRLGKEVKVTDAVTFLAGERAAIGKAYAGDIIGLHNHGTIQIGDTFSEGPKKNRFIGVPHFAPELFRRVRLKDPLKSKQLRQGPDPIVRGRRNPGFHAARQQRFDSWRELVFFNSTLWRIA